MQMFLYDVLLKWRGLHKSYMVVAGKQEIASAMAKQKFIDETGRAANCGNITVVSITLKG